MSARKSLLYVGFLLLLSFLVLQGCDSCRKLRKSKNLAERDSAAFCYYNKGQYETAGSILDELRGLYRGTAQAERINYYYAYSKYKLGESALAALFFTEFIRSYPTGKYTEEATWMVGMSHYARSSTWELDQSDTQKAIEFFQLYLQQYPYGKYASEGNVKIMELRDKLAFKAFKKADLYYRMSRYRSAIIAFKTLQTEYPDSKYRIEAAYKLFICTVQYADQSVPEKQLERYEEATDYYIRFIEKYPSNEYLREAESVFAYNQQQIKKLGGKATAVTISSNPAPKATPEKEIPKDKPAPVEKEKQEETQNEDKPKKQRIKRPERLIDR